MNALELARRYAFDGVVVALGIAFQVEAWTRLDDNRMRVAALGVLATAALLGRRINRLGAGAVVCAAAATFAAVDGRAAEDAATLFFLVLVTAWMLGSNEDRRDALAGLAVVLATVWFVTVQFEDTAWSDFLWISGMFGGSWTAGYVIAKHGRQTRDAEERVRTLAAGRREEAERAVAEERRRIARELHDVVAHHVSVMTVQAGGVRRLLLPEQEREREAVRQIEDTGRQALAEMRRLLDMLKDANETPTLAPQPSLRSLDGLVAQVREAGLPVELRIEGDPVELPPGIDLSAYRIVQEALTNALKYAGPARAEVRVDYGDDDVLIEVSNDGAAAAAGDGGGHGIVGMRERVAVFGGTLQAGPRDDGRGYVVRARLPISEPVA